MGKTFHIDLALIFLCVYDVSEGLGYMSCSYIFKVVCGIPIRLLRIVRYVYMRRKTVMGEARKDSYGGSAVEVGEDTNLTPPQLIGWLKT